MAKHPRKTKQQPAAQAAHLKMRKADKRRRKTERVLNRTMDGR